MRGRGLYRVSTTARIYVYVYIGVVVVIARATTERERGVEDIYIVESRASEDGTDYAHMPQ